MGQLLDVINVEVLPDYNLVLTFENKEVRLFNMSQYMGLKPFNKLKDTPLFKLAKVEYGTVVWPGEIDIAPETLYIESKPYQKINPQGTLQATA
jgi:hypothetical protein